MCNLNNSDHQAKILAGEVEPILENLLHQHLLNKKDWFPSELIPCKQHLSNEESELLQEIKERSQNLSDTVRLTLILNMITEEGLPLFHRLLYEAFGPESLWEKWRDLWTSEEDKHGNVLRDYLRDFKICNMVAVEKMQAQYIEAGWAPSWRGDAYGTIAYTSIQERATQISHRNLSKLVNKVEPTLSRILAHIAGDESRHFNFYCGVLKKLVQVDLNNALSTIASTIRSFTMPGINLAKFKQLAQVEHAIGVFGPKELAESINDVIQFTGLNKLKTIGSQNEEMLDFILQYPNKLMKFHDRFIDRIQEKIKSYRFDLLAESEVLAVAL